MVRMYQNNRLQEGSQFIMTDNEMPRQDEPVQEEKTIRLKPIQPMSQNAPAAPAPAGAASAPAQHAAPPHFSANPIPGAKQTIRLRPSTMSGIGHPPTGQASATDTSRLSKRTIKLTASRLSTVPADTIRMVKNGTGIAPMPAMSKTVPASDSAPAPAASSAPAAPAAAPSVPNDGKTDTSRLSRRTIKLTSAHSVHAQASAPAPAPQTEAPAAPTASQPTIKLNADTAGAAPTASQPTIKLNADAAPTASQPTIKLNSGAAPTASQPTIKLNAGAAPTSSQPTIKLNAGGQSSQAQRTIKLNSGSANKAGQTIRLGTGTQPSIQINKPEGASADGAAPSSPAAEINPMEQLRQSKAKAAQGSLPFFLTSLAALLILGFLCFVLYAQYANLYQGAKISIPLP